MPAETHGSARQRDHAAVSMIAAASGANLFGHVGFAIGGMQGSSRERDATERRHGVCATRDAWLPRADDAENPQPASLLELLLSFARRARPCRLPNRFDEINLESRGRYVIASIKFIAPER
jgi:hypothetical protein